MLLANGKAVPISSLHVGEMVLATNTRTGDTQPEAVAAVLVHHDTDLYDLKVRDRGRTSVIDTTSNHLFWIPGSAGGGRWAKAASLKYGTHLRTPNGGDTATVAGGWIPRQASGWMWDLTIPGNNDHDFYVVPVAYNRITSSNRTYYALAATTPILVHNSGGMDGCSAAAYQGVLHIGEEVAKGNMSHALGMSDDELADYLDRYANSGTGQAVKGGGVGRYDSNRRVMIIQRGEYSMTAFKTSAKNFLSRLDPNG